MLHLNEEDKEFLSTMWKTLMPHQYAHLSERTYRQAFAYFASILLLGFFVMALLLIPQMLFLPSIIENNTAKLTDLSIDVKVETSEPIILTESSPFVVIDTTGNIQNVSQANLLVTQDYLEYSSLIGARRINVSDLRTIGKDPEFLKDAILFSIILLGPGILIAGLIGAFLKYFIVASLIGIGGFLFGRLLRFHIEFKKAYLISFYSSTLMVLLDLITLPIGLGPYLLPVRILGISLNIISLAIMLTLFIIAIFIVGHLEVRL